jgi:hypothetical protein
MENIIMEMAQKGRSEKRMNSKVKMPSKVKR